MDDDSPPSPNEFSRIVALEAHRERPIGFAIVASPSECAALARRFDLVRLDTLSGAGELRARPGGGWRLEAKLEAKLVQSCVISLREIAVTMTDDFELDFSLAVSPDDEGEVDVADSAAEPFPRDGRLDVGEVVAQQLSLALDPFPRAPGVAWEGPAESEAGRQTPFAGLRAHLGDAKAETPKDE